MERVFADTSYWIALLSPHDQLHTSAVAASQSAELRQIVTSEMVLVEFLNALSSTGPYRRNAAVKAIMDIRGRSRVVVVPQTAELFDSAFRKYAQALDKGWSLTDCSSFSIMEEHKLTSALTQDKDFAQAGFETLLRP